MSALPASPPGGRDVAGAVPVLARLPLREAAVARTDADTYTAQPPSEDDLSSDEDALAWEAEGWDEKGA